MNQQHALWRRAAWLGIFLLSALVLLTAPAPLMAATTRHVSPTGADAGDCTLIPCKTFAYAITQAVDGDTINAADGTYNEHDLNLDKNLTLQGASLSTTIIDGGAAGRVLSVASGVTAAIADLTIQNGSVASATGGGIMNGGTLTLTRVSVNHNNSTGGTASSDFGGGIYNTGSLTLESSSLSDNHADYWGGGLFNESNATAILNNVTLSTNSSSYQGGAIFNRDATATLTRVTFSGNTATGYAGALYNVGAATATLTNVAFNDNSASYGGAIYNLLSADLKLTRVTFRRNSATTGGGIFNTNNATATLNNVNFLRNPATESGGGIYNYYAASATLNKVTFSGNSAQFGGGLYNTTSATATLTNVTFSGNSASNSGGGLANLATATLTNVTFSGNSASSSGGGIYHNSVYGGTTNLKNTIVANSPSGGNCSGAVTSQGHNLESSNTCGLSIALKDRVNRDPKLGPLQKNGGYTLTRALLQGSPAIDRGTNNGCPTTDQRGARRPIDGNLDGVARCDIGAYEYKP